MLSNTLHYFFPDLKREELRKFILLGATGFFVVGTYWLLRLLKQTIFMKVAFPVCLGWAENQGALFQPLAKTWSPFVVLCVVLIYSKLIDLFKKQQLFYIICTFYGLFFATIAGLILVKEWHGAEVLGKTVLANVGWSSYFAIESFGSLVVALFWSFTNSITDSESAKRGFPLIVSMMQFGAIGGSALLLFSGSIAMWQLLAVASMFTFAVVGMIAYFMKVMPADQLVGNKAAAATEKKKESFFEGFFSGLVLLVTRPYLLGVLVVSTFYEIAMQIVEYQMHVQAASSLSESGFCWFQGIFGVGVNSLSFLVALLGTSYLIKRIGVRLSLLVYPIVFALVLAVLFGAFNMGITGSTLLWATFATMMVIKGMSYAFNNPIKEMMYIPTSKDAKFKSKGWVDMFGGRLAKAGGAQVNDMFKHNLTDLMVYGTYFSFGLIGAWIVAALFVGKKNQQLVQDGKIIE